MVRTTSAALASLASVALALAILASPACVIPSISQNTDAGTTAAASGDAGTAAAATTTALGATCTQITSSISLCEFINLCPSFSLNTSVFPQCGFRIHGDAIDPECLCQNEYLCPVGHPTTCTEAAQAASGDVNYDSVCQQAVTGGCTDLTATTGGGSTTSAACQACANACDNVPSCVDACGC
jgi:hypothetical protein